MNHHSTDNEKIAQWVKSLERAGWVEMTVEAQQAYAEEPDNELFWIAVDIVTERDLANR